MHLCPHCQQVQIISERECCFSCTNIPSTEHAKIYYAVPPDNSIIEFIYTTVKRFAPNPHLFPANTAFTDVDRTLFLLPHFEKVTGAIEFINQNKLEIIEHIPILYKSDVAQADVYFRNNFYAAKLDKLIFICEASNYNHCKEQCHNQITKYFINLYNRSTTPQPKSKSKTYKKQRLKYLQERYNKAISKPPTRITIRGLIKLYEDTENTNLHKRTHLLLKEKRLLYLQSLLPTMKKEALNFDYTLSLGYTVPFSYKEQQLLDKVTYPNIPTFEEEIKNQQKWLQEDLSNPKPYNPPLPKTSFPLKPHLITRELLPETTAFHYTKLIEAAINTEERNDELPFLCIEVQPSNISPIGLEGLSLPSIST